MSASAFSVSHVLENVSQALLGNTTVRAGCNLTTNRQVQCTLDAQIHLNTTLITSMPGFANRCTSMPGQSRALVCETWRDTRHKALCLVSAFPWPFCRSTRSPSLRSLQSDVRLPTTNGMRCSASGRLAHNHVVLVAHVVSCTQSSSLFKYRWCACVC
eukprot:COSAG02_NODE_7877_length_2807_cov_2.148080_2_plen_158_part_00